MSDHAGHQITEAAVDILSERARILAQPPEADVGETVGLVLVHLGPERYGIHIDSVDEIRALAGLTAVPGLPSFWAGVVNLRGSLHAVLDLRRYLGLPQADRNDEGPTETDRGGQTVALVSAGGVSVAFLVDEVSEVRHVPVAEIGPSLADAGGPSKVITGLTKDLVSILDVEALLSDPKLLVRDGA
jgi:purine-binding chemotaxis protein CheW